MEKWEKISERAKDFNFAVDKKGNVVAVQEEDLEVRIVNLEKAKNVINDRYDAMKEKLDSCENKHRTALIQHGMDPADTKAVGEWVDGPGGFKVWKMKKSSTSNPEELMRRKQKRSNQSVDTETEE
jgi:hypothetical protein